MGDTALPYILPKISDPRLETIKFFNLLSALYVRRNKASQVAHGPIDATIDLTTTCQLKCPYCAVGNGTMERPVALMKPERYRHILSSIGDEVFIIWYFSTGEPLLHKQFANIISTSKHQEIFSAISTNLSLPLSDQRIDDLIRSGLGMISVSVDGATEQTYSRYRIGGKFDLVLENIGRLVRRKRELGLEFPLIEWRFLRFRHNQHEENLAREMAKSLGVDLIEFFSGYAPTTAGNDQVQLANVPLKGAPVEGPALTKALSGQRGLLDQILADDPLVFGLPEAKTDERKCDWLYFGTMIYPDGAVGPCCVANDKQDDFCNLDEHSTFSDAWNAPNFTKARDLFALNKRSHTVCDRCPMPGAQTYQFGQKLRAMLRIAPPWVLKILDSAPEKFFFEIDRLLMPGEVGTIFSRRLGERFPELRNGTTTAPELPSRQINRRIEAWFNG
jgi:MoaA/NifB/PqqE/SkfB family radical SAM enzyme